MTQLRDARLRQALEHAPDAHMAPDARTRAAIRAFAVPQAAAPVARASWWRRLMGDSGSARMPWNAAFATLLLATLVALMWKDEELPDAKVGDRPIAVAPPARTQGELPRGAESVGSSARDTTPAPTARDPSPRPVAEERKMRSAEGSSRAPTSATAGAARPQAAPVAPSPPPPAAPSAPPPAQSPGAILPAPSPPVFAAPAPAPAAADSLAEAAGAARADARARAEARRLAPPPPPSADMAQLMAKAAQGASALSRAGSAGSASGLQVQGAASPSGAAMDGWTEARIAIDGRSSRIPRAQAERLAQQVEAITRAARAARIEAPPAPLLRIELLQEGRALGVLEVGEASARWAPARAGSDAGFAVPIPHQQVQDLLEEARRLTAGPR